MYKIISEIVKEMKLRGLSESTLAQMAGTNQPKVHRTIAGKSKFVDTEIVKKLAEVLGIPTSYVAEDPPVYQVGKIIEKISPLEKKLLDSVRGEGEDFIRDVLKYSEKEKLFNELMVKKRG